MVIKKIEKMASVKMCKYQSPWTLAIGPGFRSGVFVMLQNLPLFSGSDVSSIAMSPVTPPTEDDEKSLRIDTGSPPTPQKIPGNGPRI